MLCTKYICFRRPQSNVDLTTLHKVMRMDDASSDDQSRTAKRLYHAIQQIRSGNLNRAESIYRKTIRDINQMVSDDEGCRNAELATTTLLLALVLISKPTVCRCSAA